MPVSEEKLLCGYRLEEQPILMPHQIVAFLFNECQLEIPEAYINQFWDNAIASGEPYATEDSRHRVPLGFYGDAAQLITKVRFEKLLCLWMNIVIFRPKSIRYSRFLIWSCDAALLYKNRTLNTVLRWVVWSFNNLYCGLHPLVRPGNRPLKPHEKARAGTWITNKKLQFQVVEIRGDWEFAKLVWQFKCSWKGGVNIGICYRCPAMARSLDPGLIYWNMDDENSTWAKEEFDTTDFICKRLPSRDVCFSVINLLSWPW